MQKKTESTKSDPDPHGLLWVCYIPNLAKKRSCVRIAGIEPATYGLVPIALPSELYPRRQVVLGLCFWGVQRDLQFDGHANP